MLAIKKLRLFLSRTSLLSLELQYRLEASMADLLNLLQILVRFSLSLSPRIYTYIWFTILIRSSLFLSLHHFLHRNLQSMEDFIIDSLKKNLSCRFTSLPSSLSPGIENLRSVLSKLLKLLIYMKFKTLKLWFLNI